MRVSCTGNEVSLTKPNGFPIFLGNVFQWFLNVRILFVPTLFTKLVGVIFLVYAFFLDVHE